jgi:hypothetical protein
MPYPYITLEEFRLRLGEEVFDRMFRDEHVTQIASGNTTNPVELLLRDACAKVAGYLRGTYDLDAVAANTPSEVKRLSLEVACAFAGQRHPECVRWEWLPRMQAAESDLKALRKGDTRLDVVGTPEPAANNGAQALSGNVRRPCPVRTWRGNFGDF